MASAFDAVEPTPQAALPERFGWLKASAGSFAIAAALFFAAGTYGFVSSPAFAIFFIGFVLFLVLFTVGLWIGAGSNGEWLGPLIALGFFVVSLMVLFNAADEALNQLKKIEAAKMNVTSS